MLIYLLISLNVGIFLTPFVLNFGGKYGDSFLNFISLGWKSNPEIVRGEYYRLLTSNFLHGGLTHLLINMISLYNVGPSILVLYNSNLLFFLIYLFSGISGSLFSFWFNSNPSLGASGAIMGLVGSLLAYAIYHQSGGILRVVVLNLVLIFVLGFIDDRIDNYGHLGGLIAGFVLGYIFLAFKLVPS